MKLDQIIETYDTIYAEEYDATFLHDGWTKDSLQFQLDLIARYLERSKSWLDVACGTGYVLSRFPGVTRAGLDISPAMLLKAAQRNPGVEFVNRDYREECSAWNDRWDLVTCMWWAYCFCETMASLGTLIERLADWTSPQGVCLVPLCNPQKFDRHNIRVPYVDPRVPGRCMITGVTWAWIQENGKRHEDMLAPQPEHLLAMFSRHFSDVRIVEGPMDVIGEGWRVQDVLVASAKRTDRNPIADLYPPSDSDRAGRLEWLLTSSPGVTSGLDYPSRNLSHVRVRASGLSRHAGDVVAQKIGFRVEHGSRYRVAFEVRADVPNLSIFVGLTDATGLTGNYGLGANVDVPTEWRRVELTFSAERSCPVARLHFDVGLIPVVQLRSLTWELLA